MARFEIRENSGILFKNTRKEEPTHADYRGEAKINGTEYWVNAWIKTGKNGKFMSFSYKPKEAAKPKLRVVGNDSEMNDEIPF